MLRIVSANERTVPTFVRARHEQLSARVHLEHHLLLFLHLYRSHPARASVDRKRLARFGHRVKVVRKMTFASRQNKNDPMVDI
jgi:hypothetical protein